MRMHMHIHTHEQVMLSLAHMHSCLSVGHFAVKPLPLTALRTPPTHPGRAEGTLACLSVLAGRGDALPSMLERMTLYLDVTKRPGQQRISVALQDPLCLSVSLPLITLFHGVGTPRHPPYSPSTTTMSRGAQACSGITPPYTPQACSGLTSPYTPQACSGRSRCA